MTKKMKRTFVLGAGASAFAGYPLGLDLWRFLNDPDEPELNTKAARDAVSEMMKPILLLYPPKQQDRPDLEQLFTLLDLGHLGAGPVELRRDNWPVDKKKITRLIAENFQWHEVKFQAQIVHARRSFGLEIDRGFGRSVLAGWVDHLKPGDTIVSFNWDLLHEAALWRVGKWHFADGYGFRCRDASENVQSPIKVLKLHGSVNWSQESETSEVAEIEHKKDFFDGAVDDPQVYEPPRRSGWNMGRNLIVPTYMKDLSANRLLLRLWKQARTALSESDEIIVIGYSLNAADAGARELFATALDQRQPAPRLLIISPDQIQWDRFCHHLGIERIRVRKKFEDWITTNPLSL